MLTLNDHGLVELKDYMAIPSQRYGPKLFKNHMGVSLPFKSCHEHFKVR